MNVTSGFILSGITIELFYLCYSLFNLNPQQTVIKYMVLFLLVFTVVTLLYIQVKGKILDKKWIMIIILFALIFQLTLLKNTPELSDDIYRYIWDGKLQQHGINPYTHAPADPILHPYHSHDLPRLVNFPEIKTIYPPAIQLIFRLSYLLFRESTIGLKFLFILFQLGSCYMFYLILRLKGSSPALLILFAWNPLVVMETSINGHLDIVLVFFLIISVYFFYRRWFLASGVMLGISVLVKLIPIILLPLFILTLFKERGGKRLAFLFLVTFIITIAFFYAFFIGSAQNMFLTALNYSSKWYFNNPLFLLILFITGNNPAAHLVSFSIFILVLFMVLFKPAPFEKKMFFIMGFFIVFNPTIHPWYLMLLVGLMCVYFLDLAFLWSGFIIFSYLVVYQFKVTGEWEDAWLPMVLEYIPLLVFVGFRVLSKKAGNILNPDKNY